MFSNLKNIFKVEDLRKKVLFTLAMIAVYRFGTALRVPGVDAAQHVARHGIDANVVDLPLSENSVAATIDSYARTSGADLTVMGGFGHSRLREFILGGVTRSLLREMTVPVLLSH